MTSTNINSGEQGQNTQMVFLDSESGSMPRDLLWWRNCSNEFPRKDLENFPATLKEGLDNLKLLWNFYTTYFLYEKFWKKNNTTFDPAFHNTIDPNKKGAPLGGVGAGTITRSFQGDFTRWNIAKPGIHHNNTIPVNQFSVRTRRLSNGSNNDGAAIEEPAAMVLNSNRDHLSASESSLATERALCDWTWWGGEMNDHRDHLPSSMRNTSASYYSLYPRSWYRYEQPDNNLELTCRQFSPIIGDNYRETTYPVALFEWEAYNSGDSDMEVSLMFTWQNGGMLPAGREYHLTEDIGSHRNEVHQEAGVMTGVKMSHTYTTMKEQVPQPVRDPFSAMIAAKSSDPGVQVTVRQRFETNDRAQCRNLWEQFVREGNLDVANKYCSEGVVVDDSTKNGKSSKDPTRLGCAVCVKVLVPAGERKRLSFTLAWDHPRMQLGKSSYLRRYTLFYGCKGNVVEHIARDALQNSSQWNRQIVQWQQPVLQEATLPNWLKGHLFNELYYVADGGTVWTAGKYDAETGEVLEDGKYNQGMGHFGYLEGHEYIMVNTYDVHFYGSNAFLANWPELQLGIQRDFARTVDMEDTTVVKWYGSSTYSARKNRGTMPHDMGTIDEDTFMRVNSYAIQDVNRWKDLNCMFVLTVLRDYRTTGNKDFLRSMWPQVETLLHYHTRFDKDQDGIVENEGFPDNTYDMWTVTGVSAFTGGLYISSNRAAAFMATELGMTDKAKEYEALAKLGAENYVRKLWNGKYFNYDSSDSAIHDSIQADQLHSQFILELSGVNPVIDMDKIRTTLKTIYDMNVVQHARAINDGVILGAVNGMRPDGTVDDTSIYSHEVWCGVSYVAAATMMRHGMLREALDTTYGVHRAVWDTYGMWFQVPESFYTNGAFRASTYMRPLAVWSIWLSLQAAKRDGIDITQ